MSMKQRINLGFFAKKAKLLKNGNAPVYMRITVNGKRVDLGINRSIAPDDWDAGVCKAMGRSREAKQLNQYLDTLKYQVMEIFHDLCFQNDIVTAKQVKMKFLGEESDKLTIVSTHEKYNAKLLERVGVDFEMSTYYKYRSSVGHLSAYIKEFYDGHDVYLEKLDHDFVINISNFSKALKKFLKIQQSVTISI